MLTRIYIDNFRSFVNFEFRPKQKQLLLGANGSGKSSLLEAIRNVRQFIKGDGNPFTQSTRTRWQDKPLQVVEIDALLDGKKYEYRVEIEFASETKQVSVHSESLKVDGTSVFELVNGEIRFFSANSSKATTVPLKTTQSALHLAQLSNSNVQRFIEWTDGYVHCFRIDEYPGALGESSDREEEVPDSELENLAEWYRHLLQAYPVENIAYLKSLKETLSGFQSLRFSSDEDGVRRLRADFATPASKNIAYSLSELSEGQRCLISLYMILHFLIDKGHTVFIDEPDNFISLREIQPWLLTATQAVEDSNGQLILISHHPELLNQWASEYGLSFFREENGHVRTEEFRGDPDKNLSPSELIARGWSVA